jgi:hypothetical protein
MMPSSFLPCPSSLSLRLLDLKAGWPEIVRAAMEAQDHVPELGACLVETEQGDAVRIGGTDLHGDLYLRRTSGADGDRAELASRRGDAAVREALLAALGDRVAPREPDERRLAKPTLAEMLDQLGEHLLGGEGIEVASAAIDAAHASRLANLDPVVSRLRQLTMPASLRGEGATDESPSPRRAMVDGAPVLLDQVIEHACPWTDRWVRLHLAEAGSGGGPEDLLGEVRRRLRRGGDERWIIGWVDAG